MEPTMTRTTGEQVQLYDEQGRLLGTIVRPVTPQVLGPGAEKVYLARRVTRAGASTDRASQHAA
jgi:hypothetical protein